MPDINPFGGMQSFIFGDDENLPSYEQLVMRRKIAAALAARQRGFPKNVGEGLTYFGEALGDRLEMAKLARLEQRAAREAAQRTSALQGLPGYRPGSGPPVAPPAPPPQPVTSPEAPIQQRVPVTPPPAPAAGGGIGGDIFSGSPTEASAMDLAPPGPIGGAPPVSAEDFSPTLTPGGQQAVPDQEILAGPRQRALDMQSLDPAVANEMDLAVGGTAAPAARPGSPEWQRLQDYRESQGQPRQAPPDPALMRPRLDATGEPSVPATAPVVPTRPSAGVRQPPPAIKAMIDARVPEADRPYYYQLALKESTYRPDLTSKTGAAGLFQFTRGTGRQYGIAGDARYDPERNLDAAVRLTEDNRGTLREGLGREPTFGEMALAHQQGATTAVKMLTGTGNAPAYNLAVNRAGGLGPEAAAQKIMAYYAMPDATGGGIAGTDVASPAMGRDRVAASLAARPGALPRMPATAPTAAPDATTDALLAETIGLAPPVARPQVAAAPPVGGVMSDAPPVGLPMGLDPGIAQSVQQRRNAITDSIMQGPGKPAGALGRPGVPPPAPPVPGAPGALPGPQIAQVPPATAIPGASQVPPELFSPNRMAGGAPPMPPAAAVPPPAIMQAPVAPPIRQAPPMGPAGPTSQPSAEPLPPAFDLTMPEPGPAPKRAPPRPLSELQQRALRTMNDPRAGPDEREQAKHYFDIDEKYRLQAEAQDESDFKSRRELHEKAVTEKAKFEREAPERRIKQLVERTGLEKTRADLEKAYYEATTPREQARIKADLDILETRRKVYAPETVTAAGTQFQRPYSPTGGPPQPFTVPPGLPAAKEEPLTEAQAKGLQFVMRVRPDIDRVDTQMAKGKILTNAAEAAKDVLPIGVGNVLISDEYRAARDALGNWGAGFLTHVSGAAVSPSEALRNLPAFIPRPGDSQQEVDDKAQRRRDFTNAIEKTTTPGALKEIHTAVDKLNFDYQAKVPAVRVNSVEEARQLPPGQKFVTPDGRELQVQPRRRP